MLTGKVESVTLVKHISEGLDQCKVRIDFDELIIFDKYADLLKFIGEQVQYSVRQDIVDGQITTVIVNIVDKFTVQILDKVENIRLLPGTGFERAVCTCDIDSLRYGDKEFGVIALLTEIQTRQSDKAKWIDCRMVDKNSKVFTLRIFTSGMNTEVDPVEIAESLIGKYVKFDILSTAYGYQTKEITYVDIPVVVAPEVEIAYTVLMRNLESDKELNSYVNMFNLLNVLKDLMSGDIGYELVYMAAELSIIESIQNISSSYDIRALKRAVYVSRGYLLPCNTRFSKPILNFNKLVRTNLKLDKELLLIIDPVSIEEASSTKKLYYFIRDFVKKLVDERRGLSEETNSWNVDSVRTMFGGLL